MEGIIVGVDESPHAQAALKWAVDHAAHTHDPVTAVMAWGFIDQHHLEPDAPFDATYTASPADMAVRADRSLRTQLDRVDTTRLIAPVERRAVADRPSTALLEAASLASVVVVGSRGHGQLASALLGSVSDQVSHHASCPVVVIP